MTARWMHGVSVLAAVLLLAGPGRTQELRSARVSDVRGGLVVRGAADDEFSYVERNAVLREGDTLWSDDKGRAEVELEYGSWLRLADDTKVELRGLPPSAELHLWAGSIYLDLSERMPDGLRVRTPAGDVNVRPESVVRVDLSRDERVRVSVQHGLARVTGDGRGSVLVAAGERTYLAAGQEADQPAFFNRQDGDSFDHYHQSRVDYYVQRPLPRELDRDLLGARDLQDYGSWVVVDQARCWRPRYAADWRPYSSGYWSFVPGFGYSWVDYAPWGYLTSHYGGWRYLPVHGWLWYPGYDWAPSYVAWSTYGSYCGWAPLDPFGAPCYYGSFGPGSGFGLTLGFGNVFIDYRSWTFCDFNNFHYGRHHRSFGRTTNIFVNANDVHLNPNGFRFGNDALVQIGVPRERFRGLVNYNGNEAKAQVLRSERLVPTERLKRIESRFGVPPLRDADKARVAGRFAPLQQLRDAKLGDDSILRGNEALRQLSPALSGRAGLRGQGDGRAFAGDRGQSVFGNDRKGATERGDSIFGGDRKPGLERGGSPFDRDRRPGLERGDSPLDRDRKPGLDRGDSPFGGDRKPGLERGGSPFDRDRKLEPGRGDRIPGKDGASDRVVAPGFRSDRDSPFRRESDGKGQISSPGSGGAPRDFPRRDLPGTTSPERRFGDGDGFPKRTPPEGVGGSRGDFPTRRDDATRPPTREFPGSGGGSLRLEKPADRDSPFRRNTPDGGTGGSRPAFPSPDSRPRLDRGGDSFPIRPPAERSDPGGRAGSPGPSLGRPDSFPRRDEVRPPAGGSIFPRRDDVRPPSGGDGSAPGGAFPSRSGDRPSYGSPSGGLFPSRGGDRPSYGSPSGGSFPSRGGDRPSYGSSPGGSFPSRGSDRPSYGGSGSSAGGSFPSRGSSGPSFPRGDSKPSGSSGSSGSSNGSNRSGGSSDSSSSGRSLPPFPTRR